MPGGSWPPLGRHDDRSPRSSVDSRQATTGNARRAGSQETRELELSQGWMRSAWRVPRWSAGRRARRETARCRAEATANGNVCAVARLQMNLRRSALRSLGLLRGGESRIKQNPDAAASRVQSHCRNKIGSNLFSVKRFCRADQDIPISSLCNHTLPIRRC